MSGSADIPCRVRTITAFIGLRPAEEEWPDILDQAAAFLVTARESFECEGYSVQTTRIATNPFPEFAATDTPAALHRLDALCQRSGIAIASAGPAAEPAALHAAVVPALSKGCKLHLAYTLPRITETAAALMPCVPLETGAADGLHRGAADAGTGPAREGEVPAVSIAAYGGGALQMDGSVGLGCEDTQQHYRAAAKAILDIADATGGAANFNFCVTANCHSGVPFFPAAHAASGAAGLQGFAVGLENDELLARAARAEGPAAHAPVSARVVAAFAPDAQRVEAVALRLETQCGVPYLGQDTSLVPGLDTPAVTESVAALAGLQFGGPGTLAACAAITRGLKALPVRATGYCGMMLPVCEDAGLAAAARQGGALGVQKLLAYSSVCGVGLDTVPVPGRSGDARGDADLQREVELLLADVASLAFRLNKPLSVRLLPMPGMRPGQLTALDSPYLIDTHVMSISS